MTARDAGISSTSSSGGGVRLAVWLGHMALPLLALWLLLAQPQLDVHWQHRPGHFWLVLTVAAINVILSFQILRAARRRGDARLLLVGYGFMLAAGFLLLHALATPGVIVTDANGGFEIATPVGLAFASALFALASVEFSADSSTHSGAATSAMDHRCDAGRGVIARPAAASHRPAGGGRRARAGSPSSQRLPVAAVRFFLTHRRKPSVMLVALISASALLAEAMATIIWARTWQLSWWLWHLLMAAAFGFVAYSAYTQYQREGGAAGTSMESCRGRRLGRFAASTGAPWRH
jgi:hypothetical protein